jgi:hypothetical protein
MTMDLIDDLWGHLDIVDVLETFWMLATTPVSKKAKHGRFDCVHVAYPRGDKDDTQKTSAGEAVRHMRAHGVVCGCIGFDSQNTYWLIRRNHWEDGKWAQWLLNNELGTAPVRQPKSNWKTRRRNRR